MNTHHRAGSDEQMSVPMRAEVVAFLLGEGHLDGRSFGDEPPKGEPFWWRKYLRTALAQAQGAEPVAEVCTVEPYISILGARSLASYSVRWIGYSPEKDAKRPEIGAKLYLAPPDYEAMKAECDRLAAEVEALKASQPQEAGPLGCWRPMDTAPKDGTMLRLLVQFDDHATEDSAEPRATIGTNTFDHSEIDEWKFAGWSWSHDCFTEGVGTPVGWFPMVNEHLPPRAQEAGQARELPPLPQAWGTMYGNHQEKELEGYTAAQMRGYAIDALLAGQASPVVPDELTPMLMMNAALCIEQGENIQKEKRDAIADKLLAIANQLRATAPSAPQQKEE